MQRVLRIVLIITFMLLLILWISTIFNTCNKDKSAANNTEMTDSNIDTSAIFEDLGDDFFEDTGTTTTEEEDPFSDSSPEMNMGNEGFESDPVQDPENYNDYTGNVSPGTSSNNNTSSRSNTANTTSNAGENANYLIVAGSFLVKANAEKMRDKLNGWGYNAEVRNFNFSQYYSVIAGRFNSKSRADQKAGELKAKGINCYVQKRKL